MTDKINNGGPAFPQAVNEMARIQAANIGVPVQQGMTLRDYFAAKAMQSLMVMDGIQYAYKTEDHAALAYVHADAMLKARGAR